MKTALRVYATIGIALLSGCSNPFGTTGKIDPGYRPGYGVKPPQVSSVQPATGNLRGGTLLTIFGSHFVKGATVQIGGHACQPVTFVSDTKITCTLPGHSAGSVDLVVTNPDSQASTLAAAFQYMGNANPVAGFATSAGGGISRGGGFRLRGVAGTVGNPIQQSAEGFRVNAGVR